MLSQTWWVGVGYCGFIQLKISFIGFGSPEWGTSAPSGTHPRENGYFSKLGGGIVVRFGRCVWFHSTSNFRIRIPRGGDGAPRGGDLQYDRETQ